MNRELIRFFYGCYMLTLNMISWIPSHTFRRFIYHFLFKLKLGRNSSIFRNVRLILPYNITIGNNCVVGTRCVLDGRNGLKIGNNVNISDETHIWTMQHDTQSLSFEACGGQVVIEDFVWLSSRCTILPGLTIREGAVVAAGAVVTDNVDPYTIVGGVPAKKIGERPTNLNYNPNKDGPIVFT